MAYGLFCYERYVHAKQIYMTCYSENEIWQSAATSQWRTGNNILQKDRKGSQVCHSWCVEDSKVSSEVTELLLFHLGTYN